jgi:hypothetical protein
MADVALHDNPIAERYIREQSLIQRQNWLFNPVPIPARLVQKVPGAHFPSSHPSPSSIPTRASAFVPATIMAPQLHSN